MTHHNFFFFLHAFKACFPAAPICTDVDDERDPRPQRFEGGGGRISPRTDEFLDFANSAGFLAYQAK